MKRKIGITLVIILIISASVVPWVKIWMDEKSRNSSTQEAYGRMVESSIIQIAKGPTNVIKLTQVNPDKQYLAFWKDDTNIYMYLFIEGQWIELARGPLSK